MKKLQTLFVSAATIFSLTFPAIIPVVADDDAASSGDQTQMQERRQKTHERLNEMKKNRVARHWANMERKFQWAIDRLGRIADRIDSRIKKFEGKGADVAEAKAKLAEARTKLEAAKTALATAKADADTLKTSEDPKAAFETLRSDVKNVMDALKATHKLLVESIKALKGASTVEPKNSSSTPSPENDETND